MKYARKRHHLIKGKPQKILSQFTDLETLDPEAVQEHAPELAG
jgi:hypothetical protein